MNRTLGPRPRLDLIESESAYELFAAVPGAESELVEVDFKAGILSVDVQIGSDADALTPNRLAPEPAAKHWKLCVGFGDLVKGDEIRAVHSQGVLHVHLPKSELSDPGVGPLPRLESHSSDTPIHRFDRPADD